MLSLLPIHRTVSVLTLPFLCQKQPMRLQSGQSSTNRHRSIGARARRPINRSARKIPDEPLYDTQSVVAFMEKSRRQGSDLPDRDPIKIVELQNAASRFSDRYRTFVSCCLTDGDAPDKVVDLIDEANHILKAVQQKGIYNSAGFGIGSRADGSPGTSPGDGSGSGGLGGGAGRGPKLGTFARQFTLSEIVGTVARAREDSSPHERSTERGTKTLVRSSTNQRLKHYDPGRSDQKEFKERNCLSGPNGNGHRRYDAAFTNWETRKTS